MVFPYNIPKHYLYPGTLFAHPDEHLVSTVLGSCISVCLWDPRMECGGINHYMLPLWNGEGLPTPKYGNVAIDKLLRKMLDYGCRKERLVAKVFGGANVLTTGPGVMKVGDRNITLAEEMLSEHAIKIVSSDTGGHLGRRLVFDTKTGVVFVGKITKSSNVSHDNMNLLGLTNEMQKVRKAR